MARTRLAGCIALVVAVAVSSADASAAWLSFTAHLQANTGNFRVTNLSDDGFDLTSLVIELGDNAVFNTSTLKLGTIVDDGAALTFTPLATTVINGAASATFAFTGFGVGDEFGFKTKFADLLNGGMAAGYDFNNATLIATFSNGQVLQTGFVGGPTTPSSDRKAFVFTASAEETPPLHHSEPASMLLLTMGLVTLGAYRVRKARRR